jgi:outer membrane protein W
LKKGTNFNFDATYYTSQQYGFGVKYVGFTTSNSMANISATDSTGKTRYGKMSDNIAVGYIGPQISARWADAQNKNYFYINGSLGIISYVDDAEAIEKFTQTAATLGLMFDLGFDIALSKHWAFGAQVSYLMGSASEYILDDGLTSKTVKLEDDNYISFNRLDISAGIRFMF